MSWNKVNATLPRETPPEAVTLEQALGWLAEKQSKPKSTRKGGATTRPKTAKRAAGAAEPAARPAAKSTTTKKKAAAKSTTTKKEQPQSKIHSHSQNKPANHGDKGQNRRQRRNRKRQQKVKDASAKTKLHSPSFLPKVQRGRENVCTAVFAFSLHTSASPRRNVETLLRYAAGFTAWACCWRNQATVARTASGSGVVSAPNAARNWLSSTLYASSNS